LLALADASITQFSEEQVAALAAFAAGYAEHIQVEESLVYPAARAAMDEAALQAMAQDMRQRRGAPQ
jgi:hemerythrin-like domain-containing protein